jgi:hypothetical protein
MITVTAEEWIAAPSSRRSMDGEKYLLRTDEDMAAYAALEEADRIALNPERLARLEEACMAQQSKSCDSNKMALITAKCTLKPVPPKTAACVTWLDTLWAEFHTRVANGSQDYDFSSFGDCPYSYAEIRADYGQS